MNGMADRLSFSGAAVVVLIFFIALTGDAQTQPRQQPSPYDVKKNEMNVTTITLMAQGTGSTYLPIAEDLQNVLDDPKGNTLRVVPVVGRGGAQNLVDLLFLRGVDLAITQQEHLLYLKQQDPRVYGSIEQRVHYITKLYNSEFHLVAKKNIKSLRDLEGKRVSLNRALSATDVAGRTIFKLLNINPIIENIDVETSVKMVRSGELAAASSFAGAPVAGYAQIQDADLHFVPVDEITIGKRDYLRLLEQFLPSSLGGGDYPRLIGQGQSVPTLASGAMLVAYAWPEGTERAEKIKNFVNAFFENFDKLRQPPRHPKWREVALTAKVQGWTRLKAAQDWIDRNVRPAEPLGGPDFVAGVRGAPDETPGLEANFERFRRYLDQKNGGRTPRTSAEFQRLYREFLNQGGLN
jgi:TRAP transporter TAXI family solute receptor